MAMFSENQKGIRTDKANAPTQKGLTPRQTQEAQKLAYQFFVERGYEHGHDQEDWMRAEEIIRKK